MNMKMLKLLMNMALVAMAIQLATAKDYTVGSPSGSWDPATSLQTWAASHKFMVGDNLIFEYSATHDVLEVTKSDYESCTTSNPIMIEMSGKTVTPLNEAGKRYFICGIPGHCQIGMKMEVDINPTSTNLPPPIVHSPPPPTPTPSFSTPSKPPPSPPTPSNPPPSFTPKVPFVPKSPVSLPPSSPFKPKTPFSKKTPVTPTPSSSIAPSNSPKSYTNVYAPVASPNAGGPTSPVGSPALATTSSSSMNNGFQSVLTIAIAMVFIAIHGF